MQAPRAMRLQDHIRQWLGAVRLPANVRLAVDIDPQSFL
jgi:primosomal protein N' (replication factor Y)